MSGLPKGWVTTKISDISSVITGKTPKKSIKENFGNDIPFIKPGDINNQGLIKKTQDSLSIIGAKSVPKTPKNSIVVTCIGNLGRVGIASIDSATNQQINSVVPSKILNNKFIYYYLRTIKNWMEENASATTIKIINKSKFSSAPVLLAPLNEQIRIANKLDSLLAKVETTQKHLDKIPTLLKRYRQSVLAAAVSGELTAEWRDEKLDWEKVKLVDVGSGFNYGSSSKSQKTGSVPVLRMGNIQNGNLDWGNLVFTSNEDEINKYELESGDVLFNRTNSPELVGKTAIYRGEQKAIYAGYLIRVKGTDKLNTEFLNILLNSPIARDYCWKVKTDGVSQSNINAQKLKAFEFLLPEMPEQKQIVKRVEALFALADKVEQQYQAAKQRTDKLTQSILAKAFRGELVPQDPNDEPASELLARIKNEQLEQNKLLKTNIKKVVKNTKKTTRKSKMIITVLDALKEANKPLTGQELFSSAGYPNDAETALVEKYFLDVRDQLEKKRISCKRDEKQNQDVFSLTSIA